MNLVGNYVSTNRGSTIITFCMAMIKPHRRLIILLLSSSCFYYISSLWLPFLSSILLEMLVCKHFHACLALIIAF